MMDLIFLPFKNVRRPSLWTCVPVVSTALLLAFAWRSDTPVALMDSLPGPDRINEMREFLGKKEEAFDFFGESLADLTEHFVIHLEKSIKLQLENYTLHSGVKEKSIKELIPANGGSPIKSFIATTWRSGSTFIGDLLQSHPASFYHYEPLLPIGIKRIRGGEDAIKALGHLRKLFACDYTNMTEYTYYFRHHRNLFSHNQPLWEACKEFPRICEEPSFLSAICSLHPFQSIKTVRVALHLMHGLLEDESLNLRVILLIRDPRGTWQSRQHREWCPGEPDCDDPAILCKDMVDDYKAAKTMANKFPNNLRVLRYEDLSFDVYNTSAKVLDFLHLTYDERIQNFLNTHTKANIGGVSSTFRDTKTAPIHWRQDLSWQNVTYIQGNCKEAIRLWGYRLANNESHLLTFNPVGKLTFPKILIS